MHKKISKLAFFPLLLDVFAAKNKQTYLYSSCQFFAVFAVFCKATLSKYLEKCINVRLANTTSARDLNPNRKSADHCTYSTYCWKHLGKCISAKTVCNVYEYVCVCNVYVIPVGRIRSQAYFWPWKYENNYTFAAKFNASQCSRRHRALFPSVWTIL